MRCRLCKWWCDRFCGPGISSGGIWQESSRWERDHSNEWDLWAADDEMVRDHNRRAMEIFPTDPARAFQIRKPLADNGSVWAMERTGQHYEFGYGVEPDLAQAEHYYYQAQLAGSWIATLELSSLLFKHRINEKWMGILENGVESDFIPASFWLAWYRYKRSPRRKTAVEVRPLMENAARAGHPGARMILAQWKSQGKFGFHEITQGFRDWRSLVRDFHAGSLRNYAQEWDTAQA